MLITDRIFGISTKNLEVVELVRSLDVESKYDISPSYNSYTEFNPPIYILAKNKNGKYRDISSGHKYDNVDNNFRKGNILGKRILEKVSHKNKRIRYKDADRYIEEMNGLVLRGKK